MVWQAANVKEGEPDQRFLCSYSDDAVVGCCTWHPKLFTLNPQPMKEQRFLCSFSDDAVAGGCKLKSISKAACCSA